VIFLTHTVEMEMMAAPLMITGRHNRIVN